MKSNTDLRPAYYCFCAAVGGVIALIVWLYLKIANLGVTIIWDMIPRYVDHKGYTLFVCIIGGVVIGIFHKFFGPYPLSMQEAIKQTRQAKTFDYSKLPMIIAASFLSLFFGASVGPEAGLVSLLLGLAFWSKAQFGKQRETMAYLLDKDSHANGLTLFAGMVSGLTLRARNLQVGPSEIDWKRKESIMAGVTAGLCALFFYILLNILFGSAFVIPHLENLEMTAKSRVYAILLLLMGIGSGYAYLISRKIAKFIFTDLSRERFTVLNAILGGAILGVIGTLIPMSMLSGGSNIQSMQYDYLQYTPYLLIAIGFAKLFLTNICIESGWRGGQIFPMIFSGLSIGYGMAILLNVNQVYAVILVTAVLIGIVFQHPLAAIILSLIFFPIEQTGWMLLASVIGGCIPVPRVLRLNPDNNGFIYNLIHFRDRKLLPLNFNNQ